MEIELGFILFVGLILCMCCLKETVDHKFEE